MNSTTSTSTNFIPNLFWLFFDIRGRISREVYWLANALLLAVGVVIFLPHFRELSALIIENPELLNQPERSFFEESLQNQMLALVVIVMRICQFMLFVKRAHDWGVTGLVAFLSLVPMLDFAVLLFLGIVKGDSGPNKFGSATNSKR